MITTGIHDEYFKVHPLLCRWANKSERCKYESGKGIKSTYIYVDIGVENWKLLSLHPSPSNGDYTALDKLYIEEAVTNEMFEAGCSYLLERDSMTIIRGGIGKRQHYTNRIECLLKMWLEELEGEKECLEDSVEKA